MFDIVYIKRYDVDDPVYNSLKQKFPMSKFVVYNQDYFHTIKLAQQKSLTRMFWLVTDFAAINDDFVFEFNFDDYDKGYVHVFRMDDKHEGVYLFPKNYDLTVEETKLLDFKNKKEIDKIVATRRNYDIFRIESYENYLQAIEKSSTEMFWMTSERFLTINNFNYDINLSPLPTEDFGYKKKINAFLHQGKDKNFYGGIFLCPKKKIMDKHQVEFRTPKNPAKWEQVVSRDMYYDVVFISYNEPNADENYNNLLLLHPDSKRIDGVKGIHNAHKAAAESVETPMFFVVDGDAKVYDTFDFSFTVSYEEQDIVHVWRSINPINELEYGYGGIKLLPTDITKNLDTKTLDMTTSLSSRFKPMDSISNVSAFNTDPFNTWKSAFRECVKLSSKLKDDVAEERLKIWCSSGADKLYGEFAIAGALKGKEFGEKYKDDEDKLRCINDWEWLNNEFAKFRIFEHTLDKDK